MNSNREQFKEAISITQDLVKINSENPFSTELQVQNYLTNILVEMGFEYDLIEFEKDRNNIIARFPPLSKAHNFDNNYIIVRKMLCLKG